MVLVSVQVQTVESMVCGVSQSSEHFTSDIFLKDEFQENLNPTKKFQMISYPQKKCDKIVEVSGLLAPPPVQVKFCKLNNSDNGESTQVSNVEN